MVRRDLRIRDLSQKNVQPSSDSSTDPHYIAGADRLQCRKNVGHKGCERVQSIARCGKDNDAEVATAEILLKLHAPVHRDRDVELTCGEVEQRSIRLAAQPASGTVTASRSNSAVAWS